MSPGVSPREGVVRLSVNVAPSVAEVLQSSAKKRHTSVTDAVRRATALLKLHEDAHDNGQRVMLVTGTGETATYREVVIL